MSSLKDIAISYWYSGLSIIPVNDDGSKSPKILWQPYQEIRPNLADVIRWFSDDKTNAIAVVGGIVSGNLLILDFDEPGLFDKYRVLVNEAMPNLLESLPVALTPSGGIHIYLKTIMPPIRNKKLARSGEDRHVMIETRGEGGYALVPPSVSAGTRYNMLWGDLASVRQVNQYEEELLIEAARAFNEVEEKETEYTGTPVNQGTRPGDIYNIKCPFDYINILKEYGWKCRKHGNMLYWTRPGKDTGISATSNYSGNGLFHVFSTNAVPFENDKSYTPFGVLTILKFNGDFHAAAKYVVKEKGIIE